MKGVRVGGGVIDPSYRGEVKVILECKTDFAIAQGDRIAQMIVIPFSNNLDEVETLTETERGADGFGSTGFSKSD